MTENTIGIDFAYFPTWAILGGNNEAKNGIFGGFQGKIDRF
jgi:hypothetical protein